MRWRWGAMLAVVGVLAMAAARNGAITGEIVAKPPVSGAFGDTSTVEPTIAARYSFEYGVVSSELVRVLVDGGTVTGSAPFAVVQADGGVAAFEGRRVAHYVPGQGIEARMTAVFDPCSTGSSQAIGMGTDTNGYFFGCCRSCGLDGGASFAAIRRSGGVDTYYPQASWTEWTHPNLDITKGSPLSVQMQWLGFGQVTWSIEDPNTGAFRPVNILRYANTSNTPHIGNPTLPLRVEASGRATIKTPSMSLLRHGPKAPPQIHYATSGTKASAAAAPVNVFTLRVDSTFNGLPNYVPVRLTMVSGASTGAVDVPITIRGMINGTLTGAVYSAISSGLSVVSKDSTGTTPTGGREAFSFVVTGGAPTPPVSLESQNIVLGQGETLTITAQSTTGTPAAVVAIGWDEDQ